jgi:hypothetical protein
MSRRCYNFAMIAAGVNVPEKKMFYSLKIFPNFVLCRAFRMLCACSFL